jgi:ParB family chromosome partitioning protein
MMGVKRGRGLGKGLEALFENVEINVGTDSDEDAGRIVFVDIHAMKPNADQPRKYFDKDRIEELASSIERHGIIQPVLVQRLDEGYEIVAGERRWRAAIKAGLKEIPCIVKEFDKEESVLIALIENIQREDLNAIDEAKGINTIITNYGLTQEEVSKSIGKSRPYIANSLRLLNLSSAVKELIVAGKLTGGHGKALAGLKDQAQQEYAAKRCVSLNWSVRDTENYIRNLEKSSGKSRSGIKAKDQEIASIEDELKNVLGTKVSISAGKKKGKIVIDCYGKEELERLIELLKSLYRR